MLKVVGGAYVAEQIDAKGGVAHAVAVMEAIEGLITALGPGRIFLYISQGLYHPARKIRDAYWKIYNTLYIFGQDALTPIYPKLEDDTINGYRRKHLELFI